MEGATPMLMVVRYDGVPVMSVGDVADVAYHLGHMAYIDTEYKICGLYALDGDQPVQLAFTVDGADKFGENGFAFPEVTVTFPDGHTESAQFALDGNA